MGGARFAPILSVCCPGLSRDVQRLSGTVWRCLDVVWNCLGLSGIPQQVRVLPLYCLFVVQDCLEMSRCCPGLSLDVWRLSGTVWDCPGIPSRCEFCPYTVCLLSRTV